MFLRVRQHPFVILALLMTGAWSCNKGIEPSPAPSSPSPTGWMAGTIRYQHWPPADSIYDLRLVAFRNMPSGNINIFNEFLAGNAFAYPPIGQSALQPFFVDSLSYLCGLPPGVFHYVAVAQQYGPNLYADWRPVGVYVDSGSVSPASVTITTNDTTFHVNINVDFANPPPPPVNPK